MDNVINICRIGNYFEVKNALRARGLPERFAVLIEYPANSVWEKGIKTMWVTGVLSTLIGALNPGLCLDKKDVSMLSIADFNSKYNGHAEIIITEEEIMTVMVSSLCYVAHGCKAPDSVSELFVHSADDCDSWTGCVREHKCEHGDCENTEDKDREFFVSIESEPLPENTEPCPIPIDPDAICAVQYDNDGVVARCAVTLSTDIPFEGEKAEALRKCMNDIALELAAAYEFPNLGINDGKLVIEYTSEEVELPPLGMFCAVRDENEDIIAALQLDEGGNVIMTYFEYDTDEFDINGDYEDHEVRHGIAQKIPQILANYPGLLCPESTYETVWMLDDKEADILCSDIEAKNKRTTQVPPIESTYDDSGKLLHCEMTIDNRAVNDEGQKEVTSLLNSLAAECAKAYGIAQILDENGNVKPCTDTGIPEMYNINQTDLFRVRFVITPDAAVSFFELFYDIGESDGNESIEKLIDRLIKTANNTDLFDSFVE